MVRIIICNVWLCISFVTYNWNILHQNYTVLNFSLKEKVDILQDQLGDFRVAAEQETQEIDNPEAYLFEKVKLDLSKAEEIVTQQIQVLPQYM